jgi:hypothetical protein
MGRAVSHALGARLCAARNAVVRRGGFPGRTPLRRLASIAADLLHYRGANMNRTPLGIAPLDFAALDPAHRAAVVDAARKRADALRRQAWSDFAGTLAAKLRALRTGQTAARCVQHGSAAVQS